LLDIIAALLCFILGCIFLISAFPKLRHPKGFILIVLEYRILPPALGRLYARLLPPLECWLALLFFTGTAIRAAGVLAAVLLLSFIVAVSVNLARGRRLDCHCFGRARQRKIGWGLLLEDGLLLVFASALIALGQSWLTLEPWSVFGVFGLPGAANLGWLAGCLVITLCITALLSYLGNSTYQERRRTARIIHWPLRRGERSISAAKGKPE
jgi:hypothetical protein